MADDQQRANELYRLLFDHSLGLMCVHDLNGVLISLNAAVNASLGYEAGYGIGRNLREFLVPAVLPQFEKYLERIQLVGSDTGLMRLLAKSGQERIWMYRNVLHESETAKLVLGHALDITERISTERELKHARQELTRSRNELAARVAERTAELQAANDRLKDEIERRKQMEEQFVRTSKLETIAVLAGGIAHDFNNFLTIVSGNTELAKTHCQPGDAIYSVLDETAIACERAKQLASQLLTFGKGGAPVRRPTRLTELITSSVSLALAGSAVKADYEVSPDLWVGDVDAHQTRQVLHNVVLNARQAMLDSGLVEVRAANIVLPNATPPAAPGRYIRITIRDYGGGIAPEHLPKVFDPYFTTKQTGSGLGLAVAHSILMAHGGQIDVQSVVGQGTTFIIDLPASDQNPQAPDVRRSENVKGRGRILVMDDEPAIRTLLTRTLERFGYQVECAADGAEAIEKYAASLQNDVRFSAVIVDLTVPGGIGGAEAIVELLRLDANAKVIASSGYADGPILARFRDYGFADVLPKPWTPAQLSTVLADVLPTSDNHS